MNLNGVVKHYDQITPRERFELVLEARTRQDGPEIERLKQTCPRKRYSQLNAAFTDLLERSVLVALAFAVHWSNQLLRYQLRNCAREAYLLGTRQYALGYAAAANAADGEHRESFTDDDEEALVEILQVEDGRLPQIEARCREEGAKLKGVYEGFRRFCARADVSPERLLAWAPAVADQVEQVQDRLDGDTSDTPADAEVAQMVEEALALFWPGSLRDAAEMTRSVPAHGENLGDLFA